MSRFSWKLSRGRYFSTDSYELRKGGEVHAIVSQANGGGWYSYGMGSMYWNTHESPCDLEEAKADAVSRAKQAING